MSIKVTSPRAELAVLRGLTHKNKKIAGTIISNVDSTYFDNPESVEIYDALRKQMGSSGEIPSYKLLIEDPSLSEHARTFFRDSEATIQSIEDAAKATKILNRYRQLRGLYSLASKIDTELQSGKVDLENLMEDASHAVAAIRSKKSSKQAFVHFGRNNSSADLVKDLLYNDSAEDTIPTGIKPFDKESGGLMRGGLFTLGASSGGGKSLSANQLAINVASMGYKVVIVPLEMSKAEMTARIIANRSRLDVTRVLQHRLATDERELAYKKYDAWVRRVKAKGGRLTIFKPEEDMDIEGLFAALSSYECDMVIIDYISLLKGADSDDAWQKLGAMARVAKINAESTNRVNVLLCQVNDEGKIRYARAISEHSNNSWIWVTKKEEREKDVGRIRIEQPKARNSKSFPFEVGFEWSTMRVVDIESSADVGSVPDPLPNMTDL